MVFPLRFVRNSRWSSLKVYLSFLYVIHIILHTPKVFFHMKLVEKESLLMRSELCFAAPQVYAATSAISPTSSSTASLSTSSASGGGGSTSSSAAASGGSTSSAP